MSAHTKALKRRWVQMSHGTVCSACLLWPDRCTCDPKHPLRVILRGVAAALAKARGES